MNVREINSKLKGMTVKVRDFDSKSESLRF